MKLAAGQMPRVLQTLVVAVGGSGGAACRAALSSRLPVEVGSLPLATFLVNVAGCLLLGFLLELLASTGQDAGVRQGVRLCLGTGFCGGLTTYSTFVLECQSLVMQTGPVPGFLYCLLSLCCGVVAVYAGFLAARALAAAGEGPQVAGRKIGGLAGADEFEEDDR